MRAELFCLHSEQASLMLERDAKGRIVWRHCGARVDPGDLPPLSDLRGPATYSADEDIPHGLVPSTGLGWFGPAALRLRGEDGRELAFDPQEQQIDAAETSLSIASRDRIAGVEHRLSIAKLEGGAFRLETTLANIGERVVAVDACASALLSLRVSGGEVISWRGRHNAELVECREAVPEHRWERVQRGGISGHGGPPGCYVLSENAGHHSGIVFALQLAWSGDNALSLERHEEGNHLLSASAALQPGETVLQPGEAYSAPPVLLAISERGRNGAMVQQHAAVRAMLRWPEGEMTPRPVHLNSWEAVYFDHDAERIKALVEAGAAVGAERFVLDDGWFKGRRHDRAGLGDWTPDPQTYPGGLAPLAEAARRHGMQFGLWVEPEMVNPDSDLYRAHPDWVIAPSRREAPTARGQLVLDMRREEVREHLFHALDTLLRCAPIRYLKWDHNRHHAPSGGAAQTLGTYALMRRVREAHPAVEIEGCAGGGGRSDAGLAPYVHRFWTSDNLDAVARAGMQRGFLAFLPPEIMGSHVGAAPAHGTGRRQSLAFRAAIACTSHFGIELDPRTLANAERDELADWTAFYKRWRHLLHGRAVHLGEGADGITWQAHGGPDEWLLFAIRTAPQQDRLPQAVPLPFLDDAARWTVRLLRMAEDRGTFALPQSKAIAQMQAGSATFAGSWLARCGLTLPAQKAESVAIFHLAREV